MDKISIITACFNSEQFIEQTIKSVLSQTYHNWEMIIIDDCSTDKSVDIVKSFIKKDERIKLINLENNSGTGIARNKGINAATGKYIAFLDSDDLWFPNKLEKQIAFMSENNLSFTYSSYYKIDEDGENIGLFHPPTEVSYNDLLKSCHIGCLTAIYDISKMGKIYMPTIRKRQDYALWLKIFKSIKSTKGQNEILASYRIRKSSISRNKFKAAKYHWYVLREVEKLPLSKAVYFFINYFGYGLIKYLK